MGMPMLHAFVQQPCVQQPKRTSRLLDVCTDAHISAAHHGANVGEVGGGHAHVLALQQRRVSLRESGAGTAPGQQAAARQGVRNLRMQLNPLAASCHRNAAGLVQSLAMTCDRLKQYAAATHPAVPHTVSPAVMLGGAIL